MKIEFFKKENSFKKKEFDFNPNLYWEVAVICALALIVYSLFFGHNLFVQISQEPETPIVSGSSQIPMVDKDRLQKVLNYFSDRETKTAQISNSPSPLVDPSL